MNDATSSLMALKDLLARKEPLDDAQRLIAARLVEELHAHVVGAYTTGIIATLPHEMAALEATFDAVEPILIRSISFKLATASRKRSNAERVTAIIKQSLDYGNNMAAICATEMLTCFPLIDSVIVVGIAGGLPHPARPERHVRLGDVVVSGREGVAQYDFGKQEGEIFVERWCSRPPSSRLLQSVNDLTVALARGEAPWEAWIESLQQKLNWPCPPQDSDVLMDENDNVVPHPHDDTRRPGKPKVIHGKIGSANIVLKSTRHRLEIRDRFGVVAVEMEASGVADAAWHHQCGYLVIRGISDYADERKNDGWQRYAAITAAAYCRALLEVSPASS